MDNILQCGENRDRFYRERAGPAEKEENRTACTACGRTYAVFSELLHIRCSALLASGSCPCHGSPYCNAMTRSAYQRTLRRLCLGDVRVQVANRADA